MGKVISCTNQKGGVGKTTTCVNVATYVALKGYKVLLVDMDPQGNASGSIGMDDLKDKKTIYETLLGDCPITEAIYPTEIKKFRYTSIYN